MRQSQAPSVPFVTQPKDPVFSTTYNLLGGLQQRGVRDKLGLYYAEGLRFAYAALDAGVPILRYAYCPEILRAHGATAVLDRLKHVPSLELKPSQIKQIEFSPDPQGLILVLPQSRLTLDNLKLKAGSTWLGIETIRHNGNLGTIMRSMRASTTDGLMLFSSRGETVDPYEPAVVRASMGAQIGLPIVKTSYKDLKSWTYRSELRVIGASADGQLDFRGVNFRRSVLLMVGEERKGLSPGQESACDTLVKIPMAAGIDSLNVAMASTVMLFEAYCQKHPLRRK